MIIIVGFVAAVLILGFIIFFYLANGTRSRTGIGKSIRFRRGPDKKRERTPGID